MVPNSIPLGPYSMEEAAGIRRANRKLWKTIAAIKFAHLTAPRRAVQGAASALHTRHK